MIRFGCCSYKQLTWLNEFKLGSMCRMLNSEYEMPIIFLWTREYLMNIYARICFRLCNTSLFIPCAFWRCNQNSEKLNAQSLASSIRYYTIHMLCSILNQVFRFDTVFHKVTYLRSVDCKYSNRFFRGFSDFDSYFGFQCLESMLIWNDSEVILLIQ